MPDREQELAAAAAEFSAVIEVAKRRGFQRRRKVDALALRAEIADLDREATALQAGELVTGAYLQALTLRLRRVAGLALDMVRLPPGPSM